MKKTIATLVALLLAGTTSLAAGAQTSTANPAATAPAGKQPAHVTLSRHRIEQIQAALNDAGGKLAVDGEWGPTTAAALRDYQKQHHLRTTGRFDRATRHDLKLPQWS